MSIHPDIERVALLGWRVAPSSSTSRKACIKDAATAATHDLNQIARWTREFPGCSWRVVCEGSGIWGLDVDVAGPDHAEDGIAALAKLVAENEPLPRRPTTRSGGGGLCLVFKHSGEPINGKTGWPVPGIDPRRGRLSFNVPPSIHLRTRRLYRWLIAPWELSAPPAPAWLLRLVAPPPEPPRPAVPRIPTTSFARKALCRALDNIARAGEGTRNDQVNRSAYGVARFVAAGLLGEHEAIEALYAAARGTGLQHLEIKATIESAFRSGFRKPAEVRCP